MLGLMVKTGIGSPIIILLLTGILGALFWKTYRDRQVKLNNLAKNPNNAYAKMKENGEEVTDDLQRIHKYKSYSTFARIGYLSLLLLFQLFGNLMSLALV